MINYRTYTVDELATDEKFRQWILNPTGEISIFWENWMIQNPDRQATVHQAAELLLGIQERHKDDLSNETIRQEIDKLVALAESGKVKNRKAFYLNPFLKIAAMLTLITGLGYLYYLNYNTEKNAGREEYTAEASLIIKRNDTNKEVTILLSDGSIATLKKGSALRYPAQFSGAIRQVFLTGEAFFDVTKDAANPFLVFANETVIKVLGTSFRIRAIEGDNTIMVVVKTGKVSVYPKKEYETLFSDHGDRQIAGVVLQPNQQVVFNKRANSLEKGIVENPDMLFESSSNQELVFDDEPVANVLNTLKVMYGINIMFDQERLSKCPITTIFKEENLKQRINAICQAIGATYEVVDGQIILNSKGCNH